MNPSKVIADKGKDSTAVQASVAVNAAALHLALTAELAPFIEADEAMPDTELLATLVSRALKSRTAEMTAADTAHLTELADDAGPRSLREEQTAELLDAVTSMRAMLEGLFGDSEIRTYGIGGATPRDSALLVAFVKAMAETLSSRELPNPKYSAVVDRVALASQLLDLAAPLEVTLEKVALEIREAQETLNAKTAATARFDSTFQRGAATLVALHRLAGQDEVAARVRPSGRRPGRLASPAEADQPDQPDEPTDEGAGSTNEAPEGSTAGKA